MKHTRRKRSHRATKAGAKPELAGEKPEPASSILIPGLPNEVALGILVRLPNAVQARLRLVCRTWKDTMEPATMSSLRKTFRIYEVYIVGLHFHGYQRRYLFSVVDPRRRRIHRIYRPLQLQRHGSFLHFIFFGVIGHEVLFEVKPKRTAPVKALELQGLYSFDGTRMKWKDAKYSSLPSSTCVCATDMDGGYLYEANSYEFAPVERLDLKTKMWEVLPDTQVKRTRFAGVMLQGSFCIIGGNDAPGSVCNSGEVWDPAGQVWTLVPELWPFEVFQSCSSLSHVAVVMDQLYALRTFTHSAELMYYETSSKLWISLGYAPIADDDCPCAFFGLFGMDQELWLLGLKLRKILATKPSLSQPLCWRNVPYSFKADYFLAVVGAMLV